MKLYIIVHDHYTTSWRNIMHLDGYPVRCQAYVRRKDATEIRDKLNEIYGPKYCRVVTFSTEDKGQDARKKETWK